MHFRLFIARTHEQGHDIIRNEGLEYDHRKDRLLSTTGSDAEYQLGGIVPDAQKVYLLGDWERGLNADQWEKVLKTKLARVRKTLEDCKQVG